MYRLLIVDDEEKIRTGLQRIVDWNSLGFVCIGEAVNGKEAMRFIAEVECPDVILTDIRMPVLDGIGLIEQAHERGYTIKFMILSGFDDFQYAKKAIELGVFDYILKPTKLPELREKFGNLKQKLDEEKKNKALLHKSSRLIREKALRSLIYRQYQDENGLLAAIEEAQFPGDPHDILYTIVTIKMHEQNEHPLPQDLEERLIYAVKKPIAAFAMTDQQGNIVFLLSCPTDDSRTFQEDLSESCKEMMYVLKKQSIRSNIGIGNAVMELRRLDEAYQQSLQALQAMFLGGIYTVSAYRSSLDETVSIEYPFEYEKKLIAAIDEGNKKVASVYVEELFQQVLSGENIQPAQVHKICMEMIIMVYRQFQENRSLTMNLVVFETLLQLKVWFKERIDLLIDLILDSRDRGNSRIVSHIKKIIEKTYHEQITLHDIGDSLYMNPDYLSRLFKKVTGSSFIDYLTNYRIEQAKRFLKDISCKSYEVGFRVGYQNPSYFARTFKKVTGKSVSDFREEHT